MRSALKSLELEIIKGHLNGCVKNALMGPNKEDVESKLEEIVASLRRPIKSSLNLFQNFKKFWSFFFLGNIQGG